MGIIKYIKETVNDAYNLFSGKYFKKIDKLSYGLNKSLDEANKQQDKLINKMRNLRKGLEYCLK